MIEYKIPRGIITNDAMDEFCALFNSFFLSLKKKEKVEKFENAFAKYNNINYCTCFPFARTAIYYSIKVLNIPKGSEVILSPITIKPILDVIINLGLKPVFVDLNINNLNYDVDILHSKINKKTKLILITYLFGIVPNLSKLVSICKDHKLSIIEDFSQCLNGKYNGYKVGNFSDIAVYSASSTKTLDTFGGGFAITKDKKYYEKLKIYQGKLTNPKRLFLIKKISINFLRNILTSKIIFTFFTYYIIKISKLVNYNNKKMLGERSKKPLKKIPNEWFQSFTSLQAEFGLSRLKKVEQDDKRRIYFANKLRKKLKGIVVFPEGNTNTHNVYWQLLVFSKNSIETINKLLKSGVDSCSTSLEKLNKLNQYSFDFKLKNVDEIYDKTIFIPCNHKLNNSDILKLEKEILKIERF
jgi:dTDP-4-amino-4,6-dideoxygalactose transaminase